MKWDLLDFKTDLYETLLQDTNYGCTGPFVANVFPVHSTTKHKQWLFAVINYSISSQLIIGKGEWVYAPPMSCDNWQLILNKMVKELLLIRYCCILWIIFVILNKMMPHTHLSSTKTIKLTYKNNIVHRILIHYQYKWLLLAPLTVNNLLGQFCALMYFFDFVSNKKMRKIE